MAKKPDITDVFDTFNEYGNSIRRAMRGSPETWEKNIEQEQKNFRTKLDNMGLGKHIDWSKWEAEHKTK